MAQLKKLENTASDHPELKKLLESVNLDDLFKEDEIEENNNNQEENNN